MIALPPSAGDVQETTAEALPAVAVTPAGLPGFVGVDDGVTAFDGSDSGPLPTSLVACTLKVYSVPFVRADTVQLVAPVIEHVTTPRPFSVSVTVYPAMAEPLFAGAVHDREADLFPRVAATPVGASGTAMTDMPVSAPVIEELTVSVAVSEPIPALLNVTLNVCTPASESVNV
jgi:hypothetical protein